MKGPRTDTPASPHRLIGNLGLLVSFILVGLLAYSSILGNFFVSDDFVLIEAIERNGPLGIWTGPGSFLSHVFFRPVISLSLFIDHNFYGLDPSGYHFSNVLIHILNAFLVFLTAERFLTNIPESGFDLPRTRTVSFLAGLLFLVSPSHTEAVSWISGRTDAIATCFGLGAYLTFLAQKSKPRPYYVAASIALFAAALLSKESVVTLPFVFLLHEVYSYFAAKGDRSARLIRGLPLLASYFVLLLVYGLVRYASIGSVIGGYGSQVHFGIDLPTLLRQANMFLLRLYLPPMPENLWGQVFALQRILAPVIIVLLFALNAKYKVLRPVSALLLYWASAAVILLLPVLSLWISALSTAGERLIYLPSAFSSLILAYLIGVAVRSEKVFLLCSVCLLVLSLLLLHTLNENWRTASDISESILHDAINLETTGPMFVTNLPDNFRGAYIFRNGFQNALSLFCDRRGCQEEAYVLAYHPIQEINDGVTVSHAHSPNSYYVQLTNPALHLLIANDPSTEIITTSSYEIRKLGAARYRLEFRPSFETKGRLFFYSSTRLMGVED